MSPRQIQSLMHRLFYGDIPMVNGYRHLMRDGTLARDLVERLIDEYISGDEVVVYLNSQECASYRKLEAFSYIERIHSLGRLRLASLDFHGRILIEPIGIGIGSNNSFQRTLGGAAE